MVTNTTVLVSSVSGSPEHVEDEKDTQSNVFTGPFVCTSCGTGYMDIEDSCEDSRVIRRCVCGNTRFMAHQQCRHDIVVDSYNNFLSNIEVYDSETPYGAYYCTKCHAEYEELDERHGLIKSAAVNAANPDDGAEASIDVSQALANNAIAETPQNAIHIEWDDLANTFHELLTDLFGREICAKAERADYYYWEIDLPEPISPEDAEALFTITQATEYERDDTLLGYGSPVTTLGEGLCKKLMDKILPFHLITTIVDDEGVWFIGKSR
jgi:hypothetical protein